MTYAAAMSTRANAACSCAGVSRSSRLDRPPQRHHGRHEGELPELDAKVEEQQRQRDRVLRQPDLRERAGEAEAVQQTEGEGHDPGQPRGQARPPAPRVHDLGRDEA